MTGLVVHVTGTPAPQGSKRGFVNRHTNRVVMVEANKATKPWRDRVTAAAETARFHAQHQTYVGPVQIAVTFRFPHPKSHYRTGRYADLLRDNAPHWTSVKPDLDKLQRSILDSLGDAGVWRDDSQVVRVTAVKRYADDDELPGVSILVEPLTLPMRPDPDMTVTQEALL